MTGTYKFSSAQSEEEKKKDNSSDLKSFVLEEAKKIREEKKDNSSQFPAPSSHLKTQLITCETEKQIEDKPNPLAIAPTKTISLSEIREEKVGRCQINLARTQVPSSKLGEEKKKDSSQFQVPNPKSQIPNPQLENQKMNQPTNNVLKPGETIKL